MGVLTRSMETFSMRVQERFVSEPLTLDTCDSGCSVDEIESITHQNIQRIEKKIANLKIRLQSIDEELVEIRNQYAQELLHIKEIEEQLEHQLDALSAEKNNPSAMLLPEIEQAILALDIKQKQAATSLKKLEEILEGADPMDMIPISTHSKDEKGSRADALLLEQDEHKRELERLQASLCL